MNKIEMPKYYDYDPSKKLSQQIVMAKSDWDQLEKVSPFKDDWLGIIHIFDCKPIRTERGIFSHTLYATPQMKDDRAWVKYEIGFQAKKILDSAFDKQFLKTFSIEKADEIFKQYFAAKIPVL